VSPIFVKYIVKLFLGFFEVFTLDHQGSKEDLVRY